MKFDTIIIGGGLTGLVCGLRLQKAGKNCAIVSSGQSAMHFSSGTFDLLGRLPDGTPVEEPLKAMTQLGETHPYSLVGAEDVEKYAREASGFLASCGVNTKGSCDKNTWRVSPTGERRPSWLTIDDFISLESKDEKIGEKALIVNILGYLDFNTKFLADSFEKQGTICRIVSIKLEEMERLRKNPSEMRATNIARVMDREDIWKKVAEQVNGMVQDEDIVVMPAVFGLKDMTVPQSLAEAIKTKVTFVATMPPSVPGIRSQMRLKAEFEKAGGKFFLGDTVNDVEYDSEGNVKSVGTKNFGDIRLYANDFVLAAGSFFSKGLRATPDRVFEPVFKADLTTIEGRDNWFDRNFWNRQNYISFGVKADSSLNLSVNGNTISNLYGAGSILGGCNALYEGCGGGVAIITALKVADTILNR